MNRITNEQRIQIIEFYYQNACSVKIVHCALLPFYDQFNRPATVRLYRTFSLPKMQELDLHEMWFLQDGGTCHTARVTMDLLRGDH